MTENPGGERQESGLSRGGDADDAVAVDPDDEVLDEIGEESFPASDSPSFWSGPPTSSD